VFISSSGNLEGYVLIRRRGVLHPYCSNDWSNEMGLKICQKLGFPQLKDLETLNLLEYNRRKQMDKSSEESSNKPIDIELIVANESNDSQKTANDLAKSSNEENVRWTSCKLCFVKCAGKNP